MFITDQFPTDHVPAADPDYAFGVRGRQSTTGASKGLHLF